MSFAHWFCRWLVVHVFGIFSGVSAEFMFTPVFFSSILAAFTFIHLNFSVVIWRVVVVIDARLAVVMFIHLYFSVVVRCCIMGVIDACSAAVWWRRPIWDVTLSPWRLQDVTTKQLSRRTVRLKSYEFNFCMSVCVYSFTVRIPDNQKIYIREAYYIWLIDDKGKYVS